MRGESLNNGDMVLTRAGLMNIVRMLAMWKSDTTLVAGLDACRELLPIIETMVRTPSPLLNQYMPTYRPFDQAHLYPCACRFSSVFAAL